MGCSSSNAASTPNEKAPQTLPVVAHRDNAWKTTIVDEDVYSEMVHYAECANDANTCPRTDYVEVVPTPVFVLKTHRGITSDEKVFINIFQSEEVIHPLVEVQKYVIERNGQQCDLFNVAVKHSAEYFQNPDVRTKVCQELISQVNKKYDDCLSTEFSVPRITRGFLGTEKPPRFFVPRACAHPRQLIFPREHSQRLSDNQNSNIVEKQHESDSNSMSSTVGSSPPVVNSSEQSVKPYSSKSNGTVASHAHSRELPTLNTSIDDPKGGYEGVTSNDIARPNIRDDDSVSINTYSEIGANYSRRRSFASSPTGSARAADFLHEDYCRLKFLKMGYAPSIIEETLEICRVDLSQALTTLHKLTLATIEDSELELKQLWTPSVQARIDNVEFNHQDFILDDKHTSYVIEITVKKFDVMHAEKMSLIEVERSTLDVAIIPEIVVRSRHNRYRQFFQLHTELKGLLDPKDYALLSSLFPNDRLRRSITPFGVTRQAEIRREKLNAWLDHLCNDAIIFTNPSVYSRIESFFQL